MPVTMAPARNGGADLDEPGRRECLRCYLSRMLDSHSCDNSKRWTIRWRDRRASGDDDLMTELEARGGLCCDCEVVLNVWESDGAGYEADEDETRIVFQRCLGTQPGEPLSLCTRWAGWSLRDPQYEDDYNYDYEEEFFDYEM